MVTVFAVPGSTRVPASARHVPRPVHRSIAPHVLAAIETVCRGDEAMSAAVADALTPAQRVGLSALPDPLPLVAGIRDEAGAAAHGTDRRILLTAAVCVDDRVDILLEACRTTMSRLLVSRAAVALSLVAGRFRYADPTVRILVHESAELAERTEVHRALAAVYRDRGERDRELWHRSLSTMEGDGALTRPLLRLAETALQAGDAARAYAIAREAASHADEDSVDAARVVAGRAALGGGWLEDAVAWLTPVMVGAQADATAAQAFSIATLLRHGAAPTLDGDEEHTAEREFLAGRWTPTASAPVVDGGVLSLRAAVDAALADDVVAGLGMLALAEAPRIVDGPSSQGIPPGPLLRAYREVLVALLRTWHGELGEARASLQRAATAAPIALPFCGLATGLARRLELAVDGRCSELSAALDAASPLPRAQERPMERAVAAYLSGRSDEAPVHLRLWVERAGSDIEIGLPGLDEVGPLDVPAQVQPPDAARAGALRRRIRAAGIGALGHDLERIEEEARSVRSPFERGRIEALLGIAGVTRGDRAGAAAHLQAAVGMLSDAGADAWRCAVEGRLARLGEQPIIDVRMPTTPIPICAGDPLAVCRAAWQPVLTGRELQIALLIAEGSSNRDIAEQLHLSVRTVEVHAGRVFRKFDVRGRGELTALAHRTNLHA